MKDFTSQEINKFVSGPLFDENVILNKDTTYPKISIVTPSYNQAQFLERTILSVLNQNYPNLEFIIIDGGSADGSMKIIKKYEKLLAYWVSGKDKGQSHALNKGFSFATGDYIGW
jgi:glycosyltransferase involved in cell wall biosynthesis